VGTRSGLVDLVDGHAPFSKVPSGGTEYDTFLGWSDLDIGSPTAQVAAIHDNQLIPLTFINSDPSCRFPLGRPPDRRHGVRHDVPAGSCPFRKSYPRVAMM
jgi:hypothetical protein